MKILTICDNYLPGYKAGGPIRSISNLVHFLGNEYEFYIITKDRDIGDRKPYSDAGPRTWQKRGNALVRYLKPIECTAFGLWRVLSQIEYDLLYLNSFFSRLTIIIMLLRKIGFLPKKPLVLAPRGEFSLGALNIKAYKKRPFIKMARAIRLYDHLVWHASAENEAVDISKHLVSTDAGGIIVEPPIKIAAAPLSHFGDNAEISIRSSDKKKPGSARIVFMSRISRKKNLDYALRLISKSSGRVQFDIYGPNEDSNYWSKCKSLIEILPASVNARYLGEVLPKDVQATFSRYHLFLFPTLGENFGHVIPEALASGCIVLVSDRTPWRGLEKRAIGWDIALEDPSKFQEALEAVISMDDEEFSKRSNAAMSFMHGYLLLQDRELKKKYRDLFGI